MTEIKYYLIAGRNNVARAVDTEYSYLDHETGQWVRNNSLFDDIHFEPATVEITESRAKKWVKAAELTVEPLWLDEVDA